MYEQYLRNIIIELFNECYRQYYKDPSFVLRTKDKTINNFINILKKEYEINSIGFDWLCNYFIFQFEYWQDKDKQRKISLPWIIGKKAFERFCNIENWQQVSYHVNKNTTWLNLESLRQQSINHVHEDVERKRYLNTIEGFAHCIEKTSLYRRCSTCIRCKYKEKCKLLLKENYPKLYKKRCNI